MPSEPNPASPNPETPFTLSIPQAALDALRQKLALTRFPDELDDAGWAYGAPLADVKRLAARWADGFDWRAAEAGINALPMYTRPIAVDGHGTLDVHYVHQRSTVAGAVPLLFVHGWPGHFLEVRKVLPLLMASPVDHSDGHVSFHVVALSLPGFGFSEAPKKPGFAGRQYAELFNKLMLSLGYEQYVYQGGDWGHVLGTHAVAHFGGKHIKAWLTNMPMFRPPSFLSNPLILFSSKLPYADSALRARAQDAMAQYRAKSFGYMAEQATQPQTIGYSLSDSPVGLLAWIYEKLVAWTDNYPWTDDEVLEWVSVYWFSRAGPTASARIYYEMTGGSGDLVSVLSTKRTSVPLGLSYFPREALQGPPSWASTTGRVVFTSTHTKGGHFAAHEQPEELVGDVRKMFGKGGPAYGVVPGKDGYDA
ncbi:alpha/beta-hydrolase [Trametes elegans]|nr:alpha/beta-hydrolase [Trametes elegans]